MIDSGVIRIPKTQFGYVSKDEILARLQRMIAECNHTERCDVCLGVKIAIGAIQKVKE